MKTSACPTHHANTLGEQRGWGKSALSLLRPTADMPLTAHATTVDKPTLQWRMECDDKSVPQEELGRVLVGDEEVPAKAYYKAATPYNQAQFEGAGNLVKLTANTNCGYSFLRWTGNGDVYTANGTPRTDVSLQAGKDEPERWVTDTTIYIKMAEKTSGQWKPMSRTITAVCESKRRALTAIGGDLVKRVAWL